MLVLLAFLALPASASAAPLQGQWHLDEPSCAGAPCPHADSSGNNLSATEVGNPTTVPGRFGNAMAFPTESDYLNAGNKAALQPARVTLLAWVRSAATPLTVKAVAGQGANGGCSFSSYSLYTGGSLDTSGLRFYIYNGSTTAVTPPASNTIWNGAWHLVAGTFDGARVHLYVDGSQVGTGTPISGSIGYGLAGSNAFIIGGTSDTACTEQTNWTGNIDDVRVYNRALTAGEIGCLASATGSSPPGLFAGGSPPNCAAVQQPPPAPPKAVLGKTAVARTLKGKIRVKLPGSKKYILLQNAAQGLPVGSLVDARKGTIRLRTAKSSKSTKTQFGDFSGAIFKFTQSKKKSAKGLTDLILKGGPYKKVCATRKKKRKGTKKSAREPSAQSSRRHRSKKRWRRLKHKAKGRFRTRGRYSSATVRGTTWTVTDRCDGTLTSVKSGKVLVKDFIKHKRVLVKRGKRYLAKARK